MARVLVIVPAYNEEATIGSVIAQVRAALPEGDIVVVDDGSRDATAARVRASGGATLLSFSGRSTPLGMIATGFVRP